ncbi:MAG TPA: DUF2269 family protein [Acidimicrobiales bacterium]
MGVTSTGYKIVFVLHLLSVIVGFGAVALNGLYGAEAKKRKGPGGLAIGEANHAVSDVAEKVVFLVPIFGIGLVLMSDEQWTFGQTWVWLSLLLYVIGVGVAHAVMIPSAKRMNALAAELVAAGPPPMSAGGGPAGGPPPQAVEMEAIGKRLAMGGGFLNLMLVAVVALMVFKPGI